MADEQDEAVSRKSCWINSTFVNQAKAIAAHKRETTSEVIERFVDAAGLAAEFAAVAAEMSGTTKAGA